MVLEAADTSHAYACRGNSRIGCTLEGWKRRKSCWWRKGWRDNATADEERLSLDANVTLWHPWAQTGFHNATFHPQFIADFSSNIKCRVECNGTWTGTTSWEVMTVLRWYIDSRRACYRRIWVTQGKGEWRSRLRRWANVIWVLALLQSSPTGFQHGTLSIRALEGHVPRGSAEFGAEQTEHHLAWAL